MSKKHKKEKIYDEQISPLVKQIVSICKENNINCFMDISIGDTDADFCETCLNPNRDSMKYTLLHYLSLCSKKDWINMDNFLLAANKEFPSNESSYYMDKAFENWNWRKEKDLI